MFSILTPTHNRADVIERVYKSLKHQTYKGFEWIVIDDASKDNTEEIVKAWQITEKEFNIKFKLMDLMTMDNVGDLVKSIKSNIS